MGPPKFAEYVLVCQELVAIYDENPEHLEFQQGELDRLSVAQDPPLLEVDLNRPELEGCLGLGRRLNPPQKRAQPGEKLPPLKGFVR